MPGQVHREFQWEAAIQHIGFYPARMKWCHDRNSECNLPLFLFHFMHKIKEMKPKGEKITMLTAYDYVTAKLVDEAGIPLILVGDSLGMVVLGYETTIPVTMEEMLLHTRAVVRGTSKALIIGDMPFMTYHLSTEQALQNAARFIQEAGTQAVKLEGGVSVADKVKRIVECGIPVMGHIGLTPQSINQFGGHKIQGNTPEVAASMLDDARALEQAGAFAVGFVAPLLDPEDLDGGRYDRIEQRARSLLAAVRREG